MKGISKKRLAMLLHRASATFTADLEESASETLVEPPSTPSMHCDFLIDMR